MSEFLFGLEWSPQTAIRANQVGSSGAFGTIPLFAGTLLISAIAMTVAVPSSCGKSTYLRCLNRMNDTIPGCRVAGEITLDGQDIYDKNMDVVELRARVGMVFQKPNPFPKSIYENVAYGPRIHGLVTARSELDDLVQQSLRRAALWEEVKDRLDEPGTGLFGGQQQRLCIARAIAVHPEVILMDEPASALDPIATAKIEEFMAILREDEELDNEFQSVMRRLATFVMEDSRTLGHCLDVVFILKALERIGDHAKNIAEYVVYLAKGKDIRHAGLARLGEALPPEP